MVTYPKDWKECRLNELLAEKPQNGLTKPKAVRGNGVKMVGMGELFAQPHITNVDMARVPVAKSEMKNYELKMNDLLFARQSLVLEGAGKCSIIADIKEPTVFESHLIRARIDEDKADANFIFYWFNHTQGRNAILSLISRVAAAGVRSSELVKIRIILPSSVYEQKAIAATLSSFDTHIDNLTALIEKKKAIRDGALSDLMSGRARLVGFNGEWGETTLGEAGRFISGNGFPVSYQGHTSGKYPFYKVSDFNKSGNEYCLIAANNYVSEEVAGKLNCNVIPSDSIVFAKIGAAIFLERKRITNSDCCIDNNMMAFNILEGNCPRYFCYLLQEMNLSDYSCITALPSLSGKTLGKVAIHLPGVDEQKAIADILTSMDTEIQNLEAERDKMQAIRAGAMDDLLTGRVRLPM